MRNFFCVRACVCECVCGCFSPAFNLLMINLKYLLKCPTHKQDFGSIFDALFLAQTQWKRRLFKHLPLCSEMFAMWENMLLIKSTFKKKEGVKLWLYRYIGKAEVGKNPPYQRLYRPILLTDCEKSREVHKVGFMVLGSRQCTI